jgi:hypothetical protein
MQTAYNDFSCLRSPLITILAGENRERLAVHSFVLSEAQSTSLQALVHGTWKECTDRTVNWSHSDLETIQRVISFLYFEDYKAPDPNERTQSSNEALLDVRPRDAVSKVDNTKAAGFASSRADNNGCIGQEVADHDLPEDEPIIPCSPQPEPESGLR